MESNRVTALRQLKHIYLSSWHMLEKVEIGLISNERKILTDHHPSIRISSSICLLALHLWGVPGSQVSVKDILRLAPAFGRQYLKVDREWNEVIWLDDMMTLMIISSLQKDDAELVHFSKWFKIKRLQDVGREEEMAHQPILYYVADLFREKKFASYEPLKECQANYRVKDPPLLVAALEEMKAGKAKKTFENLIAAALDHAKRANLALKQRPIGEINILAMYPSLLWNVAELRGMHPPTMPPEIRPFMLTRQTLGLPPIQAVKSSKSKAPKIAKAKIAKASKASKIANAKTAKGKADKGKTDKAKTTKAKTTKAKTPKAKNRKAEG